MFHFQFSVTTRCYTLSLFTCVYMCRTLCPWGFILIGGSSRAYAWNGFILTAFTFRSLHRKKEKHCCICVSTTCSLSFHSGRLSGVHHALMTTHQHTETHALHRLSLYVRLSRLYSTPFLYSAIQMSFSNWKRDSTVLVCACMPCKWFTFNHYFFNHCSKNIDMLWLLSVWLLGHSLVIFFE